MNKTIERVPPAIDRTSWLEAVTRVQERLQELKGGVNAGSSDGEGIAIGEMGSSFLTEIPANGNSQAPAVTMIRGLIRQISKGNASVDAAAKLRKLHADLEGAPRIVLCNEILAGTIGSGYAILKVLYGHLSEIEVGFTELVTLTPPADFFRAVCTCAPEEGGIELIESLIQSFDWENRMYALCWLAITSGQQEVCEKAYRELAPVFRLMDIKYSRERTVWWNEVPGEDELSGVDEDCFLDQEAQSDLQGLLARAYMKAGYSERARNLAKSIPSQLALIRTYAALDPGRNEFLARARAATQFGDDSAVSAKGRILVAL